MGTVMDMGMDIMPKEQLVLWKDLTAIATIVNVKKVIFIVVGTVMEAMVSKLKALDRLIGEI